MKEKKAGKERRIIFHVDANSAYLSWTAADLLNRGCPVDIRELPAVIAGDPENRHGIILAKSIPAKKYGIVTGESLYEAERKCEKLIVLAPDYDLYMDCSQAMYEILREYSPVVQRYSIDECFMDCGAQIAAGKLGETEGGSGTRDRRRGPGESRGREEGDALDIACELKDRIFRELGFTVNVGIGPNKLLAKMAGELKKPNMVHTIWEREIREKLWPLPVRELFMVGRATERKLRAVNINTVGELAQTDPGYLRAVFRSHGERIYRYANGVDDEPVTANEDIFQKGVGNSATLRYDMTEKKELHQTLLALCERVGMRLRHLSRAASLISISVKTDCFAHYSHQAQLSYAVDSTTELYREACRLFDERWGGEAVRQLGVWVSQLSLSDQHQLSLFEEDGERKRRLDEAVDRIRLRFGDTAVMRGSFANTGTAPLQGGVHEGSYIMMGGYEQ